MRRISMVALKANARQLLRSLALIGPPCVQAHS
jgi:hypothetical protein